MYELTENDRLPSNYYTTLNSAIVLAAQDMATKERTNIHGWFNHSELIRLPVILHQDHHLHQLWSKDPSEDTTTIKDILKAAQNFVSDYVSLDKSNWSTHQAKIFHNMRLTPKGARKNVKILAGGMTRHHKKPTVMRLEITNGKLATSDA